MTKYNLTLPKMGESVEEATIVNWLKNIGDEIKADDFIVEVATDKVDSEVPCDVDGVLVEKCFEINDVVKVGETLCVIETSDAKQEKIIQAIPSLDLIEEDENNQEIIETNENINQKSDVSFLSPLVRSIIDKEGISQNDLIKIKGSYYVQTISRIIFCNYFPIICALIKIELFLWVILLPHDEDLPYPLLKNAIL